MKKSLQLLINVLSVLLTLNLSAQTGNYSAGTNAGQKITTGDNNPKFRS